MESLACLHSEEEGEYISEKMLKVESENCTREDLQDWVMKLQNNKGRREWRR